MSTPEIVGIIVVVATVIYVMAAALLTRITTNRLLAVGFLGIAGGFLISIISHIGDLALKIGILSLQVKNFKENVEQVDAQTRQVQGDAAEAKAMKEQIEALLARASGSEQNIEQMKITVEKAVEELFVLQKEWKDRLFE